MKYNNSKTGNRWLEFNVEDKTYLLLINSCSISLFQLILVNIKISIDINEFISKLSSIVAKYNEFNYKLFERKEGSYNEYCTSECSIS